MQFGLVGSEMCIRDRAQQDVHRRWLHHPCVKHHLCVKRNNRERHRWKQRLTKDMSLRMPSSQRTMSRVHCKVQTVAMSRPSRAKTPVVSSEHLRRRMFPIYHLHPNLRKSQLLSLPWFSFLRFLRVRPSSVASWSTITCSNIALSVMFHAFFT